jgi:N-acetylneuraminate lyase
MNQRFRGLVAAPFTPFNSDRSINLKAIPAYARLLRDNGVGAAFVCGTTGEGLSMTTEERLLVAEAWAKCADDRLKLIVHVGHNCMEDARKLTRHAASIGASAVGAFAPSFFKPRDTGELVDWCVELAAAAPTVPFYYYHIPSMTGVSLPVAQFLEKAADRIPSLAGIKFTFEDFQDYDACVAFQKGRFDILFGRDEKLYEGWQHKAQGAVGSTYNYAAPLYVKMLELLNAGDLKAARALQDKSIRMIDICNGLGVTHLAASKALMAVLGVDCGPTRLPVTTPSAAQIETMCRKLKADGFFETACKLG